MTEIKSVKKSSNSPMIQTIGRRKTSTARIAMKEGTGVLKINGLAATDYLQRPTLHMIIMEPLELLQCTAKYDFKIRVNGGGKAGQAGAIRLGISRALAGLDEKFHKELRDGTFLTRDSRMKERKKYGQPGARKRFQFSKR